MAKQTGFEQWVMAGLELGALECLRSYERCSERWAGWDNLPKEKQAQEIAADLQSSWPPWKKVLSNTRTFKLKPHPRSYALCDRCERSIESRHLHTTPIGDLCAHCLDGYIQELNIDARKGG